MHWYWQPVLLVSWTMTASAAPLDYASIELAPALPLSAFDTMPSFGTAPKDILDQSQQLNKHILKNPLIKVAAVDVCRDPRVRVEWHSMRDDDRQNFVDSIKCLMKRPASGRFSAATSRYEDLIAIHQAYTTEVHGNAKFLVWHRYYLWVFEDILRTECAMTVPLPWFDETRYAGIFRNSPIFSNRWFGGIALDGRCVEDGQFANLVLNVGPGRDNTRHCLSRNGNGSITIDCNAAGVDRCNSYESYDSMQSCAEVGAHAWAHVGIGAVMNDVFCSSGDPVFWLHHAFVDRNYGLWQSGDPIRKRYVDGLDADGRPLTMNTELDVAGLGPIVKVEDVLDIAGGMLCYRYDY